MSQYGWIAVKGSNLATPENPVAITPEGMEDLKNRVEQQRAAGVPFSDNDRLALTLVVAEAQKSGDANTIDAAWKMTKDNVVIHNAVPVVPIRAGSVEAGSDRKILGQDQNGAAIEEAKSRWEVGSSGNLIKSKDAGAAPAVSAGSSPVASVSEAPEVSSLQANASGSSQIPFGPNWEILPQNHVMCNPGVATDILGQGQIDLDDLFDDLQAMAEGVLELFKDGIEAVGKDVFANTGMERTPGLPNADTPRFPTIDIPKV